jgi:O-antigen ligase
MNSIINKVFGVFPFVALSSFWLFALMNPLLKKYDYGGGLPLIVGLGVILLVVALIEFKKKRENNLWEQIFLIVFSAFFVLSFIFSEMRSFGLSEVMAFVSVVVVYLLFANRKIDWMEDFLKVVLLGGIFAIIVGGVLYVTRGEVRIFGPFFNKLYPGHVWPNAFALFLVMAWPLYLIYLKSRKVFEIAFILGLIFAVLFLTFSRGGILVLGGQIVLLGLYYIKRLNWKILFAGILTVLFAGLFFLSFNAIREQNHPTINIAERARFENHESLTSKQERMDFWLGAVELIKERPFLGWGPFSFRYAYNPIQKDFLASADHPHNIFLKIGSDNGLVALGAFLAFLLVWFYTIFSRFDKLEKDKKDLLIILGVSVSGAFAHNMIDYNFNFILNLLFLFILLAFMRSLVIGKKLRDERSYLAVIFALLLAIFSVYEGSLFLKYHYGEEQYMSKSFFPRYHYLTVSEKLLKKGEYEDALVFLEKETELSPLSAQAWYLKGVVYCKEDFVYRDDAICEEYFRKALELNPMNDFNYYHDYFRQLEKVKSPELHPMLEKIKPLLKNYFFYVEFNVHFTSYTHNVEIASSLVDAIVPYLPQEEAKYFLDHKEIMLETSARQRAEKLF